MVYLLQHSALFALLAAACWLAGVLLEALLPAARWLTRRDAAGRGARDPLCQLRRWCLGLGLWVACLFALAMFGLLGRSGVLAVLGALAVAGAVVWARGRGALPASGASPARPRWGHLLLAGVGAVTLLPFYLLALTPVVSWDAGVYHLALPKLFLAQGGFRPVAMNVYSNWPLNVELLFTAAMAVGDYVLAKLVHFGFGLLTLFALWAGCRAFHRPASGWLAMPLLLANGVVLYEIRTAYVDLAHGFFLVCGFLFMIEALERDARALWLAGICCGLAAGVKVTGIVTAVVVGALYLPRLARDLSRGERAASLRPFLIRFVLPVFALWLPWLARAAWLTGNPFYPFLHGWFGGPDWSPALSVRLQAWQSSIGMGRSPIDYLLLPVRIFTSGGEGYERFDGELGAFWLALIPPALWAATQLPFIRRCLAVAGLYFVYWSLSAQQMRFLVPVLPLLAIACAAALIEVLDRLRRARWRRAGRGLAFAAAVALLVFGHSRLFAAGYRTAAVYLRAEGDLMSTAVHPVYRFVNEHLPPDALVLMLGSNRRFFSEREVLADSFFEASQIADWLAPAAGVTELRRLLAERGVSHLLIEHRPRAIGYPAALGELLRDPEQVAVLFRSRDRRFSVLELR